MAYVEVEYKGRSFEENPVLVTWLQLFLIKFIGDQTNLPDWAAKLVDEWILNSKIDIYKYFFDEDLLDTREKIEWSLSIIKLANEKLNTMTLEQFAKYIGIDIDPQVDFTRIKKILQNVKLMLEEKDPIATH